LEKTPYMLIAGNKEVESKTVSVRKRDGTDMGAMGIEKLVEILKGEINSKK
ncbi:MAG: hypothetical protein HZA00_13520, partial [Nitrospinae bacterium]|nr:hypothetical protein [Nitrospinota bacterium]